ncbi:MAG: hypothetical protein HY815_01525 [Candidatus Riflebacteria bacterium]|nr:hypothetical protein [Candidatus Riflebacteria bacterium]
MAALRRVLMMSQVKNTVEGRNRQISDQDLICRFEIPSLLGFNLADLETRGSASVLKALETCDVVIVDQLGTLELSSIVFRRVVQTVLDSSRCVLATVTLSDDPALDQIRGRADVEVYPVTASNRSLLPEDVAARINAWVTERGQERRNGAGPSQGPGCP